MINHSTKNYFRPYNERNICIIMSYWMEGCIISDKLSDCMEKNNSEVLKQIELTFGKNGFAYLTKI